MICLFKKRLGLPRKPREKWLGLFVVLGGLAVAVTGARAQSIGDIASYAGPDRTQRLIDGAKKEGTLTLYSSAIIDDTNAITTAFTKQYGVPVQLWRGSSEDILRRAVTEARGGRYDADVAETAGTEMEGIEREKLLQPIASPIYGQLIPQAVVPNRGWVADRLSIFTATYNTTLINAADLPKSYQDLTDPKWKGKLGIESDDGNWFMSVVGAMGEAKGLALFRQIVAQNGMSLRKGHTLLANLVVAGEVPLALDAYGYIIPELKKRGAPVDGVVLPPGFALPTGIGVFVKSPHPNAAVLFMDFYLGEGQRILAARGNVPTNRTVAELPSGLSLVDVGKYLDQEDKWTALFKQTFAGGAQ